MIWSVYLRCAYLLLIWSHNWMFDLNKVLMRIPFLNTFRTCLRIAIPFSHNTIAPVRYQAITLTNNNLKLILRNKLRWNFSQNTKTYQEWCIKMPSAKWQPWCFGHLVLLLYCDTVIHDDVIKWKHFPRNWPFVRGIHRGPGDFPTQRPVTRSFYVFLDLRLNKRLSKQSWGWWFETLSRSLWRHRNERRQKLRRMKYIPIPIAQRLESCCKSLIDIA